MSKVLVIDDVEADFALLSHLVRRNRPEWAFFHKENGGSALEFLKQHPVDCVLLDYQLGCEDGLEVLKRLRAFDPTVAVIMLTGMGDESVAVEALLSGAFNYLTKSNLNSLRLTTVIDQAMQRRELEALIKTQQEALARRARLDALGEYTGGIAHDFNNLLAGIRYALTLARRQTLPRSASGNIDVALDSVDRGADMVKSLLAFAREEPGFVSDNAVVALFDELTSMTRRSVEGPIDIRFNVADPTITVRCDGALFISAILNTINNACDAINSSGIGDTIEVTACRLPEESDLGEGLIEIAVVDNGPGMEDEVRRSCTDPFFSTKTRGTGTGLGLSTTYGFARRAGGDLAVISQPGEGTKIQLMLPAGERAAAPAEAGRQKGAAVAPAVLLVEDDELQRLLLEEFLAECGHRVASAPNAERAIELAAEDGAIALLLSDVQMPGKNGFALAEVLRRDNPALPLIFMSGFTDGGCDEVPSDAPLLRKPLDLDRLETLVGEALSGNPSRRMTAPLHNAIAGPTKGAAPDPVARMAHNASMATQGGPPVFCREPGSE